MGTGGDKGRTLRRSLIGVLLAAMLALVLPAAPASAYTSLSNGNHKDRRAVDTDRPIWYGWDSTKGGYHIAVNGRWVAACGGNYCYAPEGPYVWDGHSYRLGAVDKVGLEFAHAVRVVGLRVRTYDACGTRRYDKTSTFSRYSGPRVGSYSEVVAAVSDTVFEGGRTTTWNGSTWYGGSCRSSYEPVRTACAGGAGGSGCVSLYANLTSRSYRLDAWVLPLPSVGRCYDRTFVSGYYRHSWTDESLAWSIGYPWGVGIGPAVSGKAWVANQDQDAYPYDGDLKTGRMCNPYL